MTSFSELGLAPPILRALADTNYSTPTPIQLQAIPPLLQGRDVLGIAQTGTGKTAAFALPILDRLLRDGRRAGPGAIRALVLAPTRELAAQIAESFRVYGRHAGVKVGCIVGGVSAGPQIAQLARGLDVLVATPGRLLDHVTAGKARLDSTSVVVLDEADHMLDLGFIVPIRRIISKLPKTRQNLFFSATMPREIASLADEMLRDPVRIAVTPAATTVERIKQDVFLVDASAKPDLLIELLAGQKGQRTLVFTRTKRGADKVWLRLEKAGIGAIAIHGNKSQAQRQRALDAFRTGATPVLVATDIAARGIDVEGVTHVVNYDLPEVPEAYVHRIGRTARAGADGIAIAFCDRSEQHLLRAIEKKTRQTFSPKDRRGAVASAADAPRAEPRRELRQATPPTHARSGARRTGKGIAAPGREQGRIWANHAERRSGRANTKPRSSSR